MLDNEDPVRFVGERVKALMDELATARPDLPVTVTVSRNDIDRPKDSVVWGADSATVYGSYIIDMADGQNTGLKEIILPRRNGLRSSVKILNGGAYELTISDQAESVSIALDKYGLVGSVEHKITAASEKGRGALYRAATARAAGRDLRG